VWACTPLTLKNRCSDEAAVVLVDEIQVSSSVFLGISPWSLKRKKERKKEKINH